MAYSIEVKNSFVTFVSDSDGTAHASVASSRSRSAETIRRRPEAEELEDLSQQSLQRLTTVVNSGVLQPQLKAWSPAVSRSSSPAPTNPAPTLKKSLGLSSTQKLWDRDSRVASNCSISTMAPEDSSEPSSPVGLGFKHVWSSGSISSMVSWADCIDEAEMEFELDIEAGAAAAQEAAVVSAPAPQQAAAVPAPAPQQPPGVFAACKQTTGVAVGFSHTTIDHAAPSHGNISPEMTHATGKISPEMSHSLVPKKLNMSKIDSSSKDEPPTTLMIRNIPGKYSQDDLMNDLQDTGFGDTYDFLYLPIDKGTSNNVGYGFVNFRDASVAAECIKSFEGHRFAQLQKSAKKLARVSVAHMQGLEKNLQHYQKTAVNVSKEKRRRPVVIPSMSKLFA